MAIDERTSLLPSHSTQRYAVSDPPAKQTWISPTDPENPKNWPSARKWALAILVSFYAVTGPTSSAMVVPALPQIAEDLDLTSEAMTQLLVSTFVLGWGLGPLLLAPLSESYGRRALLNGGHAMFLAVNTLCAIERNGTRFLILRFIAGFVGSAPLAIGSGIISDLWNHEERGHSLAVYTVAPLIGPTIGPIAGAFIAESTSWRWMFYGCSIFTAVSLAVGLVFLHETFAPVILMRKQRLSNSSDVSIEDVPSTPFSDAWKVAKKLARVDLPRPFILLGTQPIIQALAIYLAYLFGLNYLTISTFQAMWRENYGQSARAASLNYISIGLGFVLACETAGPINDRIYAFCKARNHNKGKPEFRTYMMMATCMLIPVGQLCYGWSAEWHLHWLLPNLGIVVYSFGLIVSYQCIQTYVLDCYPVYAASAIGSLTILRAVLGSVFPVFGPALYRGLGYGWASTMVAGIAAVIGGLAPVLLYFWGPYLRDRSPYASGDAKVEL